MRATMKILLVSVLLALIGLALVFRDQSRVEALLEQIRALGPWGPLAFILLYGIAPPLFVPGFPLTLAGVALFGPVWGTLYSLVGATGGASLAFFIARYLAIGGQFPLTPDQAARPYPYDPDKAKKLLAEAGYKQGFETSIATTAAWSLTAVILDEALEVGSRLIPRIPGRIRHRALTAGEARHYTPLGL